MNDEELITLVRAQRNTVPLTVPIETIITRGRALHTRRRLASGMAGGLAVAAVGAIAAGALTPAGHPQTRTPQATRPRAVRLAAWTVAELADGNISITLRQLQDPAGLQSTLRADGVPASVTFDPQLNSECRLYPGGSPASPGQLSPLLKAVFPQPYQSLPAQTPGASPAANAPTPTPPSPGGEWIEIDPSALPSGAGVQLAASTSGDAVLLPQIVYASPQCTGS